MFIKAFGDDPADRPQAMEWGRTICHELRSMTDEHSLTQSELEAEEERLRKERERLLEEKRKVEEEAKRPKFCRMCGNPLKPDALFCNQCGTKINR